MPVRVAERRFQDRQGARETLLGRGRVASGALEDRQVIPTPSGAGMGFAQMMALETDGRSRICDMWYACELR